MNNDKTIIVLIGPKGAGKSTIGALLARTYHIAHVEPETLWIEHAKKERSENWEKDGFLFVAEHIKKALQAHSVVVTDTTGASAHSEFFLEILRSFARVLLLQVTAPEQLCRERIRTRDASKHLPFEEDRLALVRARALEFGRHAPQTITNDGHIHPLFLLPALQQALHSEGLLLEAQAPTLQTERTLLRAWKNDDLPAFQQLNRDPLVIEFLRAALSDEESRALVERLRAGFATYGFGIWALELPGIRSFAGFVGLWVPTFSAPFQPCVELAWRLDPSQWGYGFVTEATRAVLSFAWQTLQLPELVAFTSPRNNRSLAVMKRLGMQHSPSDDFEHPLVPEGHPLRPHTLYRIKNAEISSFR